MKKEMIKLEVKARDVNELLLYWNKLGKIIQEGNTYGTLMDGWDIAKIDPDEIL